MKTRLLPLPGLLLATTCLAASAASTPTVLVSDPSGANANRAVPVSIEIGAVPGLALPLETTARLLRLQEANATNTVAVQFEADPSAAGGGRLWWLLPASTASERQFTLSQSSNALPSPLSFVHPPNETYYEIKEGPLTILRYNHGTVPVPPGVRSNYARGDYIMPLFGPAGELLTDDYPKDHPHHRGVSWSWPVTRWGKEVRDIWAASGVWARPLQIRRLENGPVFALIEAESAWKWGDTNAIVHETAIIRVFRREGDGRLVDIEISLRALADGVAIGGRPHGGYGGFGLRAQPVEQRVISLHTDPETAHPRRSWLDYSGIFKKGKPSCGLAIIEHTANLHYPNQLLQYPQLNYVMPAFPGEREVALSREQPLVLRHRLWIHDGMGDAKRLAEVWAGYANPPKAAVR